MLQAIDALEASLKLAPHPSAHLFTAWLHDKAYRWPDALRHCQAALALEPRCGTAALQIAGALTQSGLPSHDAATVDQWLDRAEAGTTFVRGTYHHVLEERGVLRLRQGRLGEAVANLAASLHFAPWTPNVGDASVAATLVHALDKARREERDQPVAGGRS